MTSLPQWDTWLSQQFSPYLTKPFAPRQRRLWQWIEDLRSGVRPRPRVEVWPRSGGKSTSVELGCARVGAKLTRRFVLYVSETQAQADKHVQNVGLMLERLGMPRAVNEYGQARGWNHQELRTATGFNMLALGLEVAVRGIKLDMFRPDMIVLDDFDGLHDSDVLRAKKVDAITTSILPAGTADCAVIAIQNVISRQSIMATLADGTADFLHDRELVTREPAVRDLVVDREITADGARYVVIGGEPTWEGQSLTDCEQQINTWGLSAFLREAQHEVEVLAGGLWDVDRDIEPFRVDEHPPLLLTVVGIDPSASATGDDAGIVAAGIDARRHAYVLEDVTLQDSPQAWARAAVGLYKRRRAARLIAEANNGGEMVAVTISTVPGAPRVKLVHASRGKQTRAQPVQKLYQDGRVHHVGHFAALERELCTWQPGMPSPNRLDALVWTITELLLPEPRPYRGASGPRPAILVGGRDRHA